jgi:hypothetical protein
MPSPAPKPAAYTRRTGASAMTANVPAPSLPDAPHRRRIQAGAALAVIPLVTLLAACGSNSGSPAAQASNPAPTQAQSQAPNSGGQGGTGAFPGASGLIAAASPGTLQVQSATAQNTVVYTAATTFTAVTAGHVAAGDCVIVTGTPAAGSTKALTATSARITAKVNGTCPTTGAGGGLGGGGSARRPTGAPTGGSAARRAFASATGTVSSVSGSTILVTGVLRNGPGATGSTTPASPSTITVTLSSTAAVTQTVPATSAAAVVGQCARAIGPADSTGTITAKSITISKPGPTGCNAGFGGRGTGAGANSTGSTGSNA